MSKLNKKKSIWDRINSFDFEVVNYIMFQITRHLNAHIDFVYRSQFDESNDL